MAEDSAPYIPLGDTRNYKRARASNEAHTPQLCVMALVTLVKLWNILNMHWFVCVCTYYYSEN